ncbi:MAG: hypothetical protein HYZ53_23320 [Planctomycetes bacterium]|nr:hypothetical protein [Planctomycetota bacterium]
MWRKGLSEYGQLFRHVWVFGLLAGAACLPWLRQSVPVPGAPPGAGGVVRHEERVWTGFELATVRAGSPLGRYPAPVAASLVGRYLTLWMALAFAQYAAGARGRAVGGFLVAWLLLAFVGQGACVCLALEVARAYRAASTVLPDLRYAAILAAGFLVPLAAGLPLVGGFFVNADAPARRELARWTAATVGFLLVALVGIVGMRESGPALALVALLPALFAPGSTLRVSGAFLLGRDEAGSAVDC